MMIIVWLAVFPLSIILHLLLKPVLDETHIIVQVAIISALIVALMTYIIMPLMSKLFHRWLHSG
jgi:hypothetical protein